MQFFFEFKLFYRCNVYKRIIITFGNTSTLSSSGIYTVHQAYFRVSNSSYRDDGIGLHSNLKISYFCDKGCVSDYQLSSISDTVFNILSFIDFVMIVVYPLKSFPRQIISFKNKYVACEKRFERVSLFIAYSFTLERVVCATVTESFRISLQLTWFLSLRLCLYSVLAHNVSTACAYQVE